MAWILHGVYLAMPPVDSERGLKQRLADPATGSLACGEGSLDLCLPNRSRDRAWQFAGLHSLLGRSLTRRIDRFAPICGHSITAQIANAPFARQQRPFEQSRGSYQLAI